MFISVVVMTGCGGSAAKSTTNPAHIVANRIYTMTNEAAGNAVLVFEQDSRGIIQQSGSFPTGGKGTGDGLENQGALALSNDDRFLFVVNPGSDDFSVFAVQDSKLSLLARVSSTGQRPFSITTQNQYIYLVNSLSNNIGGFIFDVNGIPVPIANSTVNLSKLNAGPAQISFTSNGSFLLVTERDAATIDIFPVNSAGVPSPPQPSASFGMGPFGFVFNSSGKLFVTEAFTNALSSYTVNSDGTLSIITASLANRQRATCWAAITPDNQYVFTANTGSHTISSYTVISGGALALIQENAATTAGLVFDLAVSNDGQYLYALSSRQSLDVYRITNSGGLIFLQTVTGLPGALNGVVVR